MGTAGWLASLTDLALIRCASRRARGCGLRRRAAIRPDYAIVSQDRYDFMTCKEIIATAMPQTGRMKQIWPEQIEKAEASPGGIHRQRCGLSLRDTCRRARWQLAADRAAQLEQLRRAEAE